MARRGADAATADLGVRVALLVSAAALAGGGWSFASPARMAALGQIVRADELKPASGEGVILKTLLPAACGGTPKRIGVANWNIFPKMIFDDLQAAAPKAGSLYPTPNATVGPFFQNNYFVVPPETNTARGAPG